MGLSLTDSQPKSELTRPERDVSSGHHGPTGKGFVLTVRTSFLLYQSWQLECKPQLCGSVTEKVWGIVV